MAGGRLITALSIENRDGDDVDLIRDPSRRVTAANGLVGITAREVVIPRSGHRGSRILSRWREDGAVVVTGKITGSSAEDTWNHYDSVAAAFASAVRTDRVLKWTAGSSLMLQRKVRLTSFEGPLEVGPDIISYQATFRSGDPNTYSQTLKTASAVPFGSTGGGGLTFPFTFPFHFNAPASATAAFTNAGFVYTPPVFVLQGYLHNPVIQLDVGTKLMIDGDIAVSDAMTIDVDARTMMLNGTANRRSMLDTRNSTWFQLPPGSGTIALLAEDWSTGAGLTVTWRDART